MIEDDEEVEESELAALYGRNPTPPRSSTSFSNGIMPNLSVIFLYFDT